MKLTLPAPCDIGLPAAFTSWRTGQVEAIAFAADDPRRFKGLVLPTGAGKSIIYMAIAKLLARKAVVLTSTKALQRQLGHEFVTDGVVQIQGQRNYQCVAVVPGGELAQEFGDPSARFETMTDHGPCHAGVQCSLMENGCRYYDAIKQALRADLVITNYAWWFTLARNPRISLKPDLLILDEAHAAPDALADALGATLAVREVREFLPGKHYEMPADLTDTASWITWAERSATYLTRSLEGTRASSSQAVKQLRRAKNLLAALERIGGHHPNLLVITPEMDGTELRFDVIWAADLAEQLLFRNVPRVILTSATLTEHTGDLLGLSKGVFGVYEAGDGFNVKRRPVYLYPAKDVVLDRMINVDHKMTDRDIEVWVKHIDAILESRRDRKTIIHSVSYQRRDLLISRSMARERMLTHASHNTAEQIARYKAAGPGTVLVSPSVTTGYDFPYTDCEVQIVCKIPFPDTRDPITKARTLVDKRYPGYLAMQQIVQMAGRGMRAADDQCETFVVDAHANWFFPKNADLAPKWFRKTWQRPTSLPAPPPRLAVNHPSEADQE